PATEQAQPAVQGQAQDREGQGAGARQGRTSIPGDQAPVWLHQGAFPWPGQEHRATGYAVCPVESMDGAATFTREYRRGTPVTRRIAATGCAQRLKPYVSGRSEQFLIDGPLQKTARSEVSQKCGATSDHP